MKTCPFCLKKVEPIVHPEDETFHGREGCAECDEWWQPVRLKSQGPFSGITPEHVRPEIFYAHLDECRQCRENPFGLCLRGTKKLYEAAGVKRER